MGTTVRDLVLALWGLQSGRPCRSCDQPISPRDPFGFSEGVCRACRVDAAAPAFRLREVSV